MTHNKKPGDRMWFFYNGGFGSYMMVAEMEVTSWDMYIGGAPPFDTKQEFIDSKIREKEIGFMHHEFHNMQYQSFIGVNQVDDLFDEWEINGKRVLKDKSFFGGGWLSGSLVELLEQRDKTPRIETYKIRKIEMILIDKIISFCKNRKRVFKDQIIGLSETKLSMAVAPSCI